MKINTISKGMNIPGKDIQVKLKLVEVVIIRKLAQTCAKVT